MVKNAEGARNGGAAGGQGDLEELFGLRDAYLRLLEEVRSQLASGPISLAGLARVLGEGQCPLYVRDILANGRKEERRFDAWWRSVHRDVQRRLVLRLKDELEKTGLRVLVAADFRNDVGSYDVIIAFDGKGPIVIRDKDGRRVAVELKVGLTHSLEQLERFLWRNDAIVLARLASASAAVFRRSELLGFLIQSLRNRIAYAKGLLNDEADPIPGRECYDCRVTCCAFNRWRGAEDNERIMLQEADMQAYPAIVAKTYAFIDKVVELVKKELSSDACVK